MEGKGVRVQMGLGCNGSEGESDWEGQGRRPMTGVGMTGKWQQGGGNYRIGENG